MRRATLVLLLAGCASILALEAPAALAAVLDGVRGSYGAPAAASEPERVPGGAAAELRRPLQLSLALAACALAPG